MTKYFMRYSPGDYSVWIEGATEAISHHKSKAEARKAMKRYKAGDARHEQRIADRIDGYDRDDLGESPNY